MTRLVVFVLSIGFAAAIYAAEDSKSAPKPVAPPPKTTPANTDAPKTDAPKTDAPKTDAPKATPAEPSIDNPAPGPLAGHSSHGETFNEGPRQAALLIDGCGLVHFPVTSKHANVQAFVDQGLGQLHGFWYFEAERSFRMAAYYDPDCAIAYWGMALANINNDKRAKGFIAEAAKRKDKASPRERLWIEALDEFYKDSKKTDADRRRQYVRRLEAISHEYPTDIEAKAMLVLAAWLNNGRGVPIGSHEAIDALAREVLAVNPMHPVHHYRIHLWDSEKPARALTSAAKGGQSAPGIAHMWHMPGHTYSNLQRYADAIWQQEAAARVDHAYMMRFRVMPDEIHNYAHNHEWQIRNLSYTGQAHRALELAKNMIEMPRHPRTNMLSGGKRGTSSLGRTRLIEVLSRFELWDEALELDAGGYLDALTEAADELPRVRLLAAAAWQTKQPDRAKALLASAEKFVEQAKEARDKAADKAEEDAKKKKESADKVTKARKDAEKTHTAKVDTAQQAIEWIKGHETLAAGDAKQALVHFGKAGAVAKEFLSQVNLAAGDKTKAEQLAREARDAVAKQAQPLANYVDILYRIDKKSDALKAFEQLRELCDTFDLDTPIARRLAAIAQEAKLGDDWRKPLPLAKDLGSRPALDALGPIRWHATEAPDWELPNADGQTVALKSFRGKPLVLIYYLGAGCTHCAEQLRAFKPLTEDFAKAGISLLAVSTDDVKTLKQSVLDADKSGTYPFPLVSDASMDTFRALRAYDDFENIPLHATLLLDAQGRIRWQDIGFEPFTKADFVLKEAQRLLKFDGGEKKSGSPIAKN